MNNNIFEEGACSICGVALSQDDGIRWGRELLCRDCLESICPAFDEKDNEDETVNAYLVMKDRYIGRRVKNVTSEIKRIDIDMFGHTFIHYYTRSFCKERNR